MLILIHELEEPLPIDREFKSDSLKFAHEGAQLARPVHMTATATRADKEVTIQGAFTTALGLTCSRCLKTFINPIHQPLDLFYEPMSTETGEYEISYHDMDVSYYQGDTIDIEQMLVEQIELLVPMKPVCSADCKGLCDVCGADLNKETCRCLHEAVDERLQVLVDLKRKMKPE